MAFLARDGSTQEWLKRVHVLRADAPCPEVDKQLTEGLMLSRRRTARGERALRSHTGTHVDHHVYVYVGVFVYVCISTTLKANTHTHTRTSSKLKASTSISTSTSTPTRAHKLKATTHLYDPQSEHAQTVKAIMFLERFVQVTLPSPKIPGSRDGADMHGLRAWASRPSSIHTHIAARKELSVHKEPAHHSEQRARTSQRAKITQSHALQDRLGPQDMQHTQSHALRQAWASRFRRQPPLLKPCAFSSVARRWTMHRRMVHWRWRWALLKISS